MLTRTLSLLTPVTAAVLWLASGGALAAPDLIVQSITLDPPGAAAGTGTIDIVFANIGPDDVNLSITEFTNYTVALDGTECDASWIGDLDAGATNAESTGSCNPTTPGPHDITVVIDSDAEVSEANEGNNSLTVSITWGGPDLVVQSVTLTPSSPPVDTGTLDIVFANTGSADVDLGATTFMDYTVELDGVECDGTWLFDLGQGATNAESTGNCNPTTPGPHTITVTIDSNGEVAEQDETNNVWSGTFTWTGPDLVVQSIDLDPVSPAPNVGDGSLSVTFANIGAADVALPLTNFTKYRVLLDGSECDTGTITDLAAGDTNVENISGSCLPDTPNDHTISVEIDSDGDVAETDETNNSATETFTWGGSDLVITEIVLDPVGAQAGSGTIKATIENIGGYSTGVLVNINITMFLDGVECDTGLILAGLGAGSTTTENTTSCNPATAGPHVVRFEVDTDFDVAELNESNNSLEVTLTWTDDGSCDGPELCNGLDDDCDSMTDEDFAQQLGQSCSIDNCTNDGTYACAADGSLACTTSLDDDDEVCDGEDNDCDGQVDEVWTELDTACSAGVGACESAGVYVCNAAADDIECDAVPLPTAGVENCGNGIDDDCDGAVDEDCGCEAGETQACGTDVGVCVAGSQACVNGSFSSTCVGEVPPGAESCDGLDNDCDGDVDEGCNCDDPGAEPCPAGTECDSTTGACVPSGGEDAGPADANTGTPDQANPDSGAPDAGAPDAGGTSDVANVDGGAFIVPDSVVETGGAGAGDAGGCAAGVGPDQRLPAGLLVVLIFGLVALIRRWYTAAASAPEARPRVRGVA